MRGAKSCATRTDNVPPGTLWREMLPHQGLANLPTAIGINPGMQDL